MAFATALNGGVHGGNALFHQSGHQRWPLVAGGEALVAQVMFRARGRSRPAGLRAAIHWRQISGTRWSRQRSSNSAGAAPKPSAADGEAVSAAAAVVTAPHVTADDTGAGFALEAVEAAALAKCDVMVTVGSPDHPGSHCGKAGGRRRATG